MDLYIRLVGLNFGFQFVHWNAHSIVIDFSLNERLCRDDN